MEKQNDYAKLLVLLEGEPGFASHPQTEQSNPHISIGEKVGLHFDDHGSLDRLQFIDRKHTRADLTFKVRKAR